LLKIDTERSRSINYFLINPEKKGKQPYPAKRNYSKPVWQEKSMRHAAYFTTFFLQVSGSAGTIYVIIPENKMN